MTSLLSTVRTLSQCIHTFIIICGIFVPVDKTNCECYDFSKAKALLFPKSARFILKRKEVKVMASMKDIISSPLLLALVAGGLIYIVIFSLIHLKKAYGRCLELGITKEDLHKVIKSSLVFSIVPSLSIVVGLFALISVLGVVWSWWRLSVIGSLSYESLISSSVASALKFSSTAEMLEQATGSQFGVVMILMSIGMLSGFFILIPFGRKLSMSVVKTENSSSWKYVLSGTFMLCLFAVYIPVLLIGDTIQASVMLTGLVIAVVLGILASKPRLRWLNEFIMAFSMIGGMISSIFWTKLFQ